MDEAPTRWTPARKAEILADIRAGRLTLQECLDRYGIGDAELRLWAEREQRFGMRGLCATKVQEVRHG